MLRGKDFPDSERTTGNIRETALRMQLSPIDHYCHPVAQKIKEAYNDTEPGWLIIVYKKYTGEPRLTLPLNQTVTYVGKDSDSGFGYEHWDLQSEDHIWWPEDCFVFLAPANKEKSS